MRPDPRANAPRNRGFTVVEILVVLLLFALVIWLARVGYRALTHHAAARPGSVRLALAWSAGRAGATVPSLRAEPALAGWPRAARSTRGRDRSLPP